MTHLDRIYNWALAEGSVLGLALFRIITGLMVIRHLLGYLRDWSAGGFYGNSFHLPYATWIPQPTELVYVSVLTIGIISAAFLIVGYKTRAAAITCFLMVAYHLSLNHIWYRHNRYFLVLSAFLLCFGPCGNVLSIDSRRLKLPVTGPLWSCLLIKIQMTLIYLASATSKTLDTGWRSGDVLIGRRLGPIWEALMPDWLNKMLPQDAAVRMLTAQALVSEFFLASAVWFRSTRRLAIWWGIFFHGFIEVQYSVLAFTYLTLGTYFVFSELKYGEKTWIYSERNAMHRLVARLIPYLDWLFQVRVASHTGAGQQFIGRDGKAYSGWISWVMLGANIPMTYAFCYPLSWLRVLRRGQKVARVESTPVLFRPNPVQWLGLWLALYLVFLGAANLYAPWRVPPELRRFWDLPWFFGLMCLMCSVYYPSLVSGVLVTQPERAKHGEPVLDPAFGTPSAG